MEARRALAYVMIWTGLLIAPFAIIGGTDWDFDSDWGHHSANNWSSHEWSTAEREWHPEAAPAPAAAPVPDLPGPLGD